MYFEITKGMAMKKLKNIAKSPITLEIIMAATEFAVLPKHFPKAIVFTASPPKPLGSKLLKKIT